MPNSAKWIEECPKSRFLARTFVWNVDYCNFSVAHFCILTEFGDGVAINFVGVRQSQ